MWHGMYRIPTDQKGRENIHLWVKIWTKPLTMIDGGHKRLEAAETFKMADPSSPKKALVAA